MKTFFDEKQISMKNREGQVVEFFMRPIKIKELPIINRISELAEESGAEEFTTPLLLSLMLDCLSIDGSNIPASTAQDLVNTFIEYNFPDPEKADKKEKSDKTEPLSFYIDFLVSIGYSLCDVMEMTMLQFNELIIKAGERLNPKSKVMDPLEAFRKMGIPIRKGKNG
jgi:hypothetical protein